MVQVLELITEAKKNSFIRTNKTAVEKLERFCKEFAALTAETIRGPEDFQKFVERHVPQGWEDRLEFDKILRTNFGFEQGLSLMFRSMTMTADYTGQTTSQQTTITSNE